MATYRRESRIDAPFEEVWAFHATVEGLEALTPGFMNLDVERVTGPDGERLDVTDVLEVGSRIELSVRPFGVGPRRRMVSVIDARERDDDSGSFRDVMESGPFPRWEHTHRFVGDGEGTWLVDRVEYALPGGPLGELGAPLGRVGLEPMFRGRHRTTKRLLE
jgi:ligand-binding SRPBCC domain-containing protein